MSSPTKLREMAKELGWPPELEKAADQLQKLKRENAALRERLDSVQKSHFTLSKDNAALQKRLEQLQDFAVLVLRGLNSGCICSKPFIDTSDENAPEYPFRTLEQIARAALARKEAQP